MYNGRQVLCLYAVQYNNKQTGLEDTMDYLVLNCLGIKE